MPPRCASNDRQELHEILRGFDRADDPHVGTGLCQAWLKIMGHVPAGLSYEDARIADLKRTLQSSQAYFNSALIKPLAGAATERALAQALSRA